MSPCNLSIEVKLVALRQSPTKLCIKQGSIHLPWMCVCVCVCKHLVARCRIFRGHLLGKTTCLMLQLVLISDLHFPSLSDMFEFAFSTSKFTSRGCKQHIQSCTNEDTEWCWWYHGWSPWRTCQIRDETMLRLVLLFRFSKLLLRTFDLFPLHVRLIFDASPIHFRSGFDTCPIQFRSGFDACPFHFLSQFTRPPLWRTTGWTT